MTTAAHETLPKGPVFSWRSLTGPAAAGVPGVLDLPDRTWTTSGRAAIVQALRALRLPPGSGVLVPTYHCPTMVAAVVAAGMQPRFYALDGQGQPQLDRLVGPLVDDCRAMLVAHYFGLPRSLHEVRLWCDDRRIPLIEDCAHALFGLAGERPVGAWGDLATASLTKFLPVSELGLLARSSGAGQLPPLRPPSMRQQVKALVDVFEKAARHGRPGGLAPLVQALLFLKNRRPAQATHCMPQNPAAPATEAETMLKSCDMARVDEAPTLVARTIAHWVPLARIVEARRRNFDLLAQALTALPGTRPLAGPRWPSDVPYAFPLWVDDVEPVYARLREAGLPAYRWDRLWPGTLADSGDAGTNWSRHVLQLLCHQDLATKDITALMAPLRDALTP